MARSRCRIGKLVNMALSEQPLNKMFLTDVMTAIELYDQRNQRESSNYYKPSGMVCMRQMYFVRTEAQQDTTRTEYNAIGMADTGTRRHVAIQDVLLCMEEYGYDWKYVDVEDYLKAKWAEGKCLDIEVKEKQGAETKLFHKTLLISFMCDGIIEQLSTGNHFLFEFKNQISFKYNNKEAVDKEHINQITCYALCLDLDYVFVLYENRDICLLECPELFVVTPELKQGVIDKILECEGYVEQLKPPPKTTETKVCRWCKYKLECEKAGN